MAGGFANSIPLQGLPLVGLRQRGDDYYSEKPRMLARTKSDKKPVIAALVPKRSDHLRLEEVEFVPGPGRGSR